METFTKHDVATKEPAFLKCVVEETTQIEAVEVEVQEMNVVTQEPVFLKQVVEATMKMNAFETQEAIIQT